jgi:hypothetical protein
MSFHYRILGADNKICCAVDRVQDLCPTCFQKVNRADLATYRPPNGWEKPIALMQNETVDATIRGVKQILVEAAAADGSVPDPWAMDLKKLRLENLRAAEAKHRLEQQRGRR